MTQKKVNDFPKYRRTPTQLDISLSGGSATCHPSVKVQMRPNAACHSCTSANFFPIFIFLVSATLSDFDELFAIAAFEARHGNPLNRAGYNSQF